jgi:hypothetical protein
MHARLREESAKRTAGWMRWLRKPVLAASFALVMVVGVSLVRMNSGERGTSTATPLVAVGPQALAEPGTAVGDLQALEKNQNLYSDFDVLDDLAVQADVTANP